MTSGTQNRKARRATLVLLALAAVGFAGCLGSDAAAPDGAATLPADGGADPPRLDPVRATDGRDLRTQLTARDRVEAPTWRVGEWWSLDVLLGGDETLTYTSIVVEDQGDAWLLAPPDPEAAKEEALWDLPILGPVAKVNLGVTAFGESMDWLYRFPLADGDTWAETNEGFWEGEVTFVARHVPSVSTPAGDRPGLHITGTREDGAVLLEYDYVPEVGWFAHFFWWNLDTEEPNDYEFHAMMTGHGVGWTGTYYVDEATLAVDHFGMVGLDPDAPTEPFVEPEPHAAFDVDETATYVVGFAYAFAILGAQETLLIDPEGNARPHTAIGTPFDDTGAFYDLPAIPGTWRLVNAGAGGLVGGGAMFWTVVERAFPLG